MFHLYRENLILMKKEMRYIFVCIFVCICHESVCVYIFYKVSLGLPSLFHLVIENI